MIKNDGLRVRHDIWNESLMWNLKSTAPKLACIKSFTIQTVNQSKYTVI